MTTQMAEANRERIRQKVLVVEDEADIRELLRYNLAQEGFTVEEAADGAEALDRISRRAPDLLVLDLMLPQMSATRASLVRFMLPPPGPGREPHPTGSRAPRPARRAGPR